MTTVHVPDDIEFHEFAHLFPMMSLNQHKALVDDIKHNGLLTPLTRYEGKIIDGRNRWLACKEAGVHPRVTDLPDGVDPLTFVVSANFSRRHLSESQRALAAARIQGHEVSRDDAKATFKVTAASLKQAETVLKHGTEALIESVEHDRIPVSIAAKLATMPEEVQNEAVDLKPKELRSIIKKTMRIKKTVKLAKATKLAGEKLGHTVYGVIYADPPWKFEPWSANGMDRAADNHYDTMTTDSIKEMEIPSADNAILFLWSTVPMLPAALDVMNAWGFTYKSNFVWVKDRVGTGYWNRNKHEMLLVGTKGNVPSPDPSERVDSVFEEVVGEHSAKPDAVRDMIRDAYPALPKIELFAREKHVGWHAHGNELEEEVVEDTNDVSNDESEAEQASAAD